MCSSDLACSKCLPRRLRPAPARAKLRPVMQPYLVWLLIGFGLVIVGGLLDKVDVGSLEFGLVRRFSEKQQPRFLQAGLLILRCLGVETISKTAGNRRRKNSAEISVTNHAPAKAASMVTAAAGSKADQRTCTRRLYCQVANAVPQTEALLLVPNSVAGAVLG